VSPSELAKSKFREREEFCLGITFFGKALDKGEGVVV
jgi:hypothetical protein